MGGEVAAEGAWPRQVALMISGAPLSPDGQFCGGTMVPDTSVPTAAHRVHKAGDDATCAGLQPDFIQVLVGTDTLAPGSGDLVPAAAIFRHPDHPGARYDHDIALIRLTRKPTAACATLRIPDAEFGDCLDQPGVITTVAGRGPTKGGARPETMHQAEIRMMHRDPCNAALLESRAEAVGKESGRAADVPGLTDEDTDALRDQLLAEVPPADVRELSVFRHI